MNKKMNLYGLTFLVVVAILISFSPSVASANNSNVIDWIEQDESKQQQPSTEKEKEPETENKSFIAIIGQLIFYTLLILVMIYGLIKFLAIKQKKWQPNKAINLLGGTSLGTNKSLQIVKIGGKIYLLGVSDSINLIREITDEDEIKLIEEDLKKQEANMPKSIIDFVKEKAALKQSRSTEPTAFQKLFHQSLERLKVKQNQFESTIKKSNDDKKDVRDDT